LSSGFRAQASGFTVYSSKVLGGIHLRLKSYLVNANVFGFAESRDMSWLLVQGYYVLKFRAPGYEFRVCYAELEISGPTFLLSPLPVAPRPPLTTPTPRPTLLLSTGAGQRICRS